MKRPENQCTYRKKLLKDFDAQHLPQPVTIGQDNLSAISLSQAAAYNPRTKHIHSHQVYLCESNPGAR
jgi:hypothetical protein